MRLAHVAFSLMSIVVLSGCTGHNVLNSEDVETAVVSKIIDGDTIETEDGRKIRLLGINAPEDGEYYYSESKNFLDVLIKGEVTLEPGMDDKDKYGRSLRYVFSDGKSVNLEMIKSGYAIVYVLNPEEKYHADLKDAENYAKDNKLGLWSTASNDCISIAEFQYDAPGNDNNNLNGEHVTFRNSCDKGIPMDGWHVKDTSAKNSYTFNEFVFNPHSDVTLFSGNGDDSPDSVYWKSRTAIWNNDGDTLFLRDGKGDLILTYAYPES